MFSEDLDPAWWDLTWCAVGDYPEGEIVFLPEEGDSSDFDPALDKFAPNSSNSSSSYFDEEANLGGCSGPPNFSFYMFSFNPPKVSSEFRIVEIDKEFFESPVYQYMKRKDLKDETIKLLTRRKAKEKVSEEKEKSVSPEISKSPALYQPADLYKGYPDHHEDRQKFRKDKENLLRLQIKDKHNSLKKLVKEIEELKRMLEITTRERD